MAFNLVKALVLLLLLSASFPANVIAKTYSESTARIHHLGFQVGSGVGSYREDLVVPISFDGPIVVLGGKYSAQTGRTSLHVSFDISVGLLQNRFSHEAYSAALELRPSWTKAIWSNANGRQFRLGAALPLQMRNLFMDSWDDSHLYWMTTHSIAVVGEYHTRLPRLGNSVIRFDLPLLGLVSRPPEYRYKKQEPLSHFSYHFSAPNRSLVLKGLWGYQSPMLQIMVDLGGRKSLANISLECELDHSPRPKDAWLLTTRLLFTYQWRIGGGTR